LVCLLYWEHLVHVDVRFLFNWISPFIASANFIWVCCEVYLFVAMQMHSSNGNRYTFIIISYGLRLEPKYDRLFVRLSWEVFYNITFSHFNVECKGQSPQLMTDFNIDSKWPVVFQVLLCMFIRGSFSYSP